MNIEQLAEKQMFKERFETLLGISPDKAIHVPPQLGTDRENYVSNARHVIDYIVRQRNIRGPNSVVILDLNSECLDWAFLHYSDIIVRELVTVHSFNYDNIIYITSAADVEMNRRNYYKYCIENNWMPLRIKYINTWEGSQAQHINLRDGIEFVANPNPAKKFVFMNRGPRPHRIYLLCELIKRDLIKDCFLSFNTTKEIIPDYLHMDSHMPGLSKLMEEQLPKIVDQLPINLTLDENHTNSLHVTEEEEYLYKDSLFALVAETQFMSSRVLADPSMRDLGHRPPGPFLTEKTWKILRVKHPLVLASTPFCLQALRELGYKTFHPFIDETYDTIEDDMERINAVIAEVERLCSMSEEDTIQWLKDVQPICEHNYSVLKNRPFAIK